MLTKQAAEKLAQEYYNVGQQLAMQEAGLIKEANAIMEALGRLMGKPMAKAVPPPSMLQKAMRGAPKAGAMAGGAALTPAALAMLGKGGATGAKELAMLKSLVAGEGAQAASQFKQLGGAIGADASSLKNMLMGAGKQVGNTFSEMSIPSIFQKAIGN